LFAIRRYAPASRPPPGTTSQDLATLKNYQRILWVSAAVYVVIFVRGLVYGYSMIGEIPTAAIAVGEILNASILATIISQLWKTYHQGRSV